MKICPICQRCYEDIDSTCPEDQMALVASRPGSRIIADKYRTDRLLGRGGMGTVYAGTHLDLDRPIAIKFLLSDFTADAEALERFRREARAAARLNHPNVVDTYDYGLLPDGGAYIIMEFINGQTLRDHMNAIGKLPHLEAIRIAQQVAEGMEAAHHHGIVHRDLKPSNILLTRNYQNRLLAKVADFSVAKLKEGTTSGVAALTSSGAIIGTPLYMAPEQCSGHAADTHSDIYSLGVILYEMVAGRPPFDAPTATAIAIKHIQEKPAPVSEFRAGIPAELQALIMQSLNKDPGSRPRSAAEFAERLKDIENTLPHRSTEDSLPKPLDLKDSQTAKSNTDLRTNPISILGGKKTERSGAPTVENSAPLSEAASEPSAIAHAPASETFDEITQIAGSRSRQQQSRSTQDEQLADFSATPPPHASPHMPHETEMAGASRRQNYPRRFKPFYLALAAAFFVIAFSAIALWLTTDRPSPDQSDSTNEQPINKREVSNAAPAEASLETSGEGNSSRASAGVTASENPRDPVAELRSALDEWIAATNARDLNRQMTFYAPRLNAFYLQRDASRSAVQAEKARRLARLDSVNVRIDEPKVTLGSDGQSATMRFRKSWDFRGDQPDSGEVLQELRWVKTDDGWKIVSERDLRVFR